MEKREYTVYKFEELPKESQEKAIERYRDFNVELDSWVEPDLDDFCIKLTELGYPEPKFRYDLGYSQGSGASFVCKSPDKEKLLNRLGSPKLQKLLKDKLDYLSLEVKDLGLRYVHENSTGLAWSFDEFDKELETELKNFGEAINRELYSLNTELTKALYTTYEYLTSDEAVKESLITNDYDFTLDGEID